MKKFVFLFTTCFAVSALKAQIDVPASRQILRLLPVRMQTQVANSDKDKVIAPKGKIGTTIWREYGTKDSKVFVEIINNSPSFKNASALLVQAQNNPGKHTIAVVDGYKGVIQNFHGENGKLYHELLVPFKNTLLVLKTAGFSKKEVITMAETIPVSKIAVLIK